MDILVFGSINMDLVARVVRLPKPGETLTGSSFATVPGGKGANQAVACARLGGRMGTSGQTYMIGQVGEDVFGESLRAHLRGEGVSVEGIGFSKDTPSGVAVIAVGESGENEIIVIPGANGKVGDVELDFLRGRLTEATMLLLQLEIPMEVVVEAARLGRAHGLTVILDPAPGQPLPDELYGLVDILTPNTSEAASLVGFGVESVEDARRAAEVLHQRGVPVVVIKMGGLGVLLLTSEGNHYWKAFPVNVVDTVAAGDAFNGALAVALSEGGSLSEAVRWGLAAGALAVTKKGAQEAMPSREEVVSLLEK